MPVQSAMNGALDGVRGAGTGTGAVGFKLFPEHMRRSEKHHEVAESVLRDPRVKKVVMMRENRLEVAVSKLRAASTGAFS